MSKFRAADETRHIDLDNVRLTLEYLHGDLKAVAGLGRVAGAVKAAIDEIDALKPSRPASILHRLMAAGGGRQLR